MKKTLLDLILKCTNSFFEFIKIILTNLPDRVKAQFAEKMIFLGRLDFSISEIKLLISSRYSLVRLRSCSKEKHTVNWISSFSKEDVFYDIGANVGAYSLIASKLGKCNKIYSFEPVPGTFHELLLNIKLNDIVNILACNLCLSDSNSTSIFKLSSNLPGGALHLGINSDESEVTSSFVCSTITLDNFIEINSAEIPTHIKIDVDGAELSILKGAQNTLASNKLKTIQIEIDELSCSYNEIIETLIKNDFELYEKYFKEDNQITAYDSIFKKKSHEFEIKN